MRCSLPVQAVRKFDAKLEQDDLNLPRMLNKVSWPRKV